MLGPLPTKYRVIVAASALVAFIGLGAWITFRLPGPLLPGGGAGIGAGLGLVAVLLLLHDSSHQSQPRAARARHRGDRRR